MKKFLLLISFCFFAVSVFADTIFNDGFEFGNTENLPPVGWISDDGRWTCGHFENDHNRIPHQGDWYIFTDAEDCWLFLSMDLIQSLQYNFSFWVVTDGSFNVEILCGNQALPASMTDTIRSLTTVESGAYEQLSSFFVANSNGPSYIGIHSYGNAGSTYMSIDDVAVDILLEYDFVVEAITGDTSLYLGEEGAFRFSIRNTGFLSERVVISGSNEFLSNPTFFVEGEQVSSLDIEPATTVIVDVTAHLPESTIPNSVIWLDVMVSSTHNCHTGLATFWVDPLALVADFPFFQLLNSEEEYSKWIVRGDGQINWKWCRTGYNPLCSPFEGDGMLVYAASLTESSEHSFFISPKLDLNATGNLVRFEFYRSSEMNDESDMLNVYYSESPSLENASLLGTVHRSTAMSPIVSSDGWYQYDFVFDCGGTDKGFIIFEAVSDNGLNMFLDDILVDNTPLQLSETDLALNVYPNPTQDVLIVDAVDLQRISVLDLSGKLLKSWSSLSSNRASVSFSDLPDGLYLVEILSGQSVMTRVIAKQ
jgi:hypothetical protein